MPKKECPNGHWYDPSIYGDQCPMCPQPGAAPMPSSPMSAPATTVGGGMATHITGAGEAAKTRVAPAGPSTGITPGQAPMGGGMPFGGHMAADDSAGATKVRPKEAEPQGGAMKTQIRRPGAGRPGAQPDSNGRKLVGFLVTYNRDPMGKAYNLYEGRNYIGRDASCDISISDDPQMSGRHMSILYRSVDSKFKFRDEQSSNGTFINKELLDDGTLENYDIIRVGSTIFLFMPIPIINQ